MHLLVKKKIDISRTIFTLISINWHYCAISQNLFWSPFLNRIILFKFSFKNVHVFMFYNFEPNFIGKFLWESGFSNFGHVTFIPKRKFVFWPPFWNKSFFDRSFCWYVVVLGVYTYGASFVPKFLWESTQKWMGPSGPLPPCAQTGLKSNLGT